MGARAEFGKYRLAWVNGEPKVAWSYKDADGNLVRPRHALPDVDKNSTVAELRAALIAFASRHERAELVKATDKVGAILDAYATNRERDGKVMRPILSNIRQLKPFFGQMRPADITEDVCRAYTKERATPRKSKHGKALSCSGSTILTELGRLSTAMEWAIQHKIILPTDKPVMWFPQASEPRDRVLTPDEANALLDASSGHTRLFVLMCLLTAGRTSAILELTWDRVDFEGGVIRLKAPKTVNLLQKVAKKGRAAVHMDDMLRAALTDAKQNADTPFVIEHNGRRIERITNSFDAAVTRAGLEDVTPHTLRHTAATWAQEGDVAVGHISKFLGHKNQRTTERNYTHGETALTVAPVQAVAAKLAKLRVVK